MRSKTLRGLDCIVYVNGSPWAVTDRLRWTADYGVEETFGIDKQEAQEMASQRLQFRGTLHYWRQHNTAGAEGAGIVPVSENLSRERYFYLQVVDRQTDKTYLEIPRAKLLSQEGGVSAREVADGTLNFGGLGWANEF